MKRPFDGGFTFFPRYAVVGIEMQQELIFRFLFFFQASAPTESLKLRNRCSTSFTVMRIFIQCSIATHSEATCSEYLSSINSGDFS